MMLSVLTKLTRIVYVKGPEEGFEKNPLTRTIYRFLYQRFRPSGIVLVEVEGSKMYVDSRDSEIATSLLRWGLYEKYETALFKKLVKDGMVVVDVGANIGYFTILASRLAGVKGKVFAFEPEPYNFDLLRKNVEENRCSNVTTIKKAVFSKSGLMKLFLEENNLGGHSLSEAAVYKMAGSTTIEAISLDEFFEDKHLKVDFIKLDAEGSEMAILEGMADLIRKNDNLTIITEFSPALLSKSGFSPMGFLTKLAAHGFTLYEIGPRIEQIRPNEFSTISHGEGRDLLCTRH